MDKRKDETEDRAKGRRNEPSDATEYETFQKVLEEVLSIPKEELDRRRAQYEREQKAKRAG